MSEYSSSLKTTHTLIEQGMELGWRIQPLRPDRVGWILLAKDSESPSWSNLLSPERRVELLESIRICPYRVDVMEFDQDMYVDGSYALYPDLWTRDESHRFSNFQEAVDWLELSGYPMSTIRNRVDIGSP